MSVFKRFCKNSTQSSLASTTGPAYLRVPLQGFLASDQASAFKPAEATTNELDAAIATKPAEASAIDSSTLIDQPKTKRFLLKDSMGFTSSIGFMGEPSEQLHGTYWPNMTALEQTNVRRHVKAPHWKEEKRKLMIGKNGLDPIKFVPKKKDENELYDDIEEGPLFSSIINNESIMVTAGPGHEDIDLHPYKRFDECPFPDAIKENILKKGYQLPTPVQRVIFKIFTSTKDDIVAQAQTGSGKTAAYLLPIISELHLMKSSNLGLNRDSPYAVIISPTRELGLQIYEDARSFANGTLVKPARVIGGIHRGELLKEVQEGCDLVICTMGRLIELLNSHRLYVRQIKILVMDEADVLIKQNEAFDEQIKALKELLNISHRTLMFSATYGDEVAKLVDAYVKPSHYSVLIGALNCAVDTINCVHSYEKTKLLVEMLKDNGDPFDKGDGKLGYKVPKTLVFVNRKKMADRLAIELTYNGIKSWSMNADRPQALREEALQAFQQDDESCVLVSTDLIARGHNIKKLDVVINYDLPSTIIQYIHRIGRTGRKGNIGYAISYFNYANNEDTKQAGQIIELLQKAKKPVPEWLFEVDKIVQEIKKDTLEVMEKYKSADRVGCQIAEK